MGEWVDRSRPQRLCVFDPLVRFSTPGHLSAELEQGPYFDPFEPYGLDSDPVPKKLEPDEAYAKREPPAGIWDCFALTRHDRLNLRDDQFSAFRGH